MPLLLDRERCAYCGGCVGVCPTLALELVELTLIIDEALCTECGACVQVCPVGALSLTAAEATPVTDR
jgi:ferredoxin